MVWWLDAPSSPTNTAQYLYDGEGNRVEQQTVSNCTTTTTVNVGSLESAATTGGTTTTTTSYYALYGAPSYLASDFLGIATVTLAQRPTRSQ